MTIETLVEKTFATADAAERLAAADAQFAIAFVALSADAQARCWRGLDHGAKFRLVVRRIEAIGKDWTPSTVEAFIAKYDERFALGPVEQAIEGALERLAEESAGAMRLARADKDKAGATFWQRTATSYTNALIEYRKGIRPELLASGAWLLPSRRPGEAPHIVRMDGDWTCSCKAGASMHWSLALIIGIEVAHDDMQQFDDPPGDCPLGDEDGDSVPDARNPIAHAHAAAQWIGGQQLLSQRLAATAQLLDAMRAAEARPAQAEARRLGVRLVQARKKSAYFTSAFYLNAA